MKRFIAFNATSFSKRAFICHVRVNFPLLYVVIMSLLSWVGGSKKPKTPLGAVQKLCRHIRGIVPGTIDKIDPNKKRGSKITDFETT